EEALTDEIVESCSNREARDAEIRAQFALRGDRVPHRELLDQIEHALARLALLRDDRRTHARHPRVVAARWSIPLCHVAATSTGSLSTTAVRPRARLAPVATSKKWNREGSTASARVDPTR